MDILLSLLFSAGVIAQILFMTRGKEINLLPLLLVLLFSSIALLPIENETLSDYDYAYHIFAFFIVFSVFFSLVFKEQILPEINEATVLSFTIVFWFLFIVNFIDIYRLLLIIAPFATIGTAVISFSKIKIGTYASAFFYAWFLIMALFIAFSQLFYLDSALTPVDVFVGGMVCFYLIAYVWYVFELVPLPAKGEGITARIKRWKEDIHLMASRYSDYQLPFSHAIAIVIVEIGVLTINHFVNIVPEYLLVSICILFIPQLVTSLDK